MIEAKYGINGHTLFKICLDVAFILIGITADVILIGTLAKAKQPKTSANTIIMHLSISHLVYVVCSPLSTYLAIVLLRNRANSFFICVADQAEKVFLFVCISFAIALTIDWFAINCTTRFKAGNATSIVKFIWAAMLPFAIVVFFSTCMETINTPVSLICLAILEAILLVSSLAFQIVRFVKVARDENVAIKSAASLNVAALLAEVWLLWLILVFLMRSEGAEVMAWLLAKCVPVAMLILLCNDRTLSENIGAIIKRGSPVRRNEEVEGGVGEAFALPEA